MRVYHTSNVAIEHPDVYHSRRALDFGKGFYLTRLRQQAEQYGMRFKRMGDQAMLNVYELDEDIASFTIRRFGAYDGEWLDFIVACRREQPHKIYDFIEGGIADDKVFDTIDLYMQGIYDREKALGELRYKQPNHQICITSQLLLDQRLHHLETIPL